MSQPNDKKPAAARAGERNSGVMSRRRFLEGTTVAVVATGAAGLGLSRAEASKKSTQKQVRYQDEPKAGRKCVDCAHFVAEDNTCAVVEGEISAEGWCLRWVNK